MAGALLVMLVVSVTILVSRVSLLEGEACIGKRSEEGCEAMR